MSKFAVVCGPGRTGTSLATKLVEACGYSLGKCLPPNKEGSLRHGYGEHPLSNAQGEDIEKAMDGLEAEGANCIKLIHLYAQWIPRLIKRGYDVKVVVTSRPEKEIWDSGMDIYPGWKPQAIQAICGTASRILAETGQYLINPHVNAYELPFHEVVKKDEKTLLGLARFLMEEPLVDGVRTNGPEMWDAYVKMLDIVKPKIVKHVSNDESK